MITFDTFTGDENSQQRQHDGNYQEVKKDTEILDENTPSATTTEARTLEIVDVPLSSSTTTAVPSQSRLTQLFNILTLKQQKENIIEAKSALFESLLGFADFQELLMSKATVDQVTAAVDDALAEEIFATVDYEEHRLSSIQQYERDLDGLVAQGFTGLTTPHNGLLTPAPKPLINNTKDKDETATDLSLVQKTNEVQEINDLRIPAQYRMLELVHILDSASGGMVKKMLTKVRQRPMASLVDGGSERKIEYCSFCGALGDHSSSQHRCRICNILGKHRSRYCDQLQEIAATTTETVEASPRDTITDSSTSSLKYCTLCCSTGYHTSIEHRCHICNALGQHRSRDCTKKTFSEGYRWRGSSPNDQQKHCEFCNAWGLHSSEEHRCRQCQAIGLHRSKNCPSKAFSSNNSNSNSTSSRATTATTPSSTNDLMVGTSLVAVTDLVWCDFCQKECAHKSEEHICRVCRATGMHRSNNCPASAAKQSIISSMTNSVIESIKAPVMATSLVWNSIDKIGDVDTVMRKTLRRIGVWGGGSQTPMNIPYARRKSRSNSTESPQSEVYAHGLEVRASTSFSISDGLESDSRPYVLAYSEGHSVVPERILKYMRLLMHHEISTRAFSVIVRFDSSSCQWELAKPGMVTPRSLPTSPRLAKQLQTRMEKYTLKLLLGAQEKLSHLVQEQKRKLAELHQYKTKNIQHTVIDDTQII